MTKKRAVVLILTILIINLLFFVSAAENQTDIEKGYSCLKSSIDANNCVTRYVPLNAFNLLAGAYDSSMQTKCKASLLAKKNPNECWPQIESGACDLKSTALAIMALDRIEENVEKPINWTLGYKRLETSLIWYLEIEATNASQCTINGKNIIIGDDKKITTPAGNPDGLEKAYSNYWFKITKLEKNYTISCNKSFTTSLLYQKPGPTGSGVYYVSSNPHSASAGDSTVEKVDSYCFGPSSGCDYEATLWVTMALAKHRQDISPYLPYLSSRETDVENQKYLPSAFLLMLTEMSEYEEELKGLQKEGKYWGDRTTLLDLTPLGLSALYGRDLTEVRDSERYLLSLQDKVTGCWQDDKTSYILYLTWPKTPTSTGPINPNGTQIISCEDRTYSCVASTRCEIADQESYECSGFGDVCCSKPIPEMTCEEQGGAVCKDGEKCSESTVEAGDELNCCLKDCVQEEQETQDPCPSTTGYSCKNKCAADERYNSVYKCAANQQCCYKEQVEKSNNLWLIILLIILIILVFLAILFRNQLQVWWFRIKSGTSSKKGPGPTSRPIIAPPYRPVPARPIQRQETSRMYRPMTRPEGKDKEFEDTMKKLRDMSK